MRVLIADDQKDVGSSLAALVTECHHEVVDVVASGFDAIQAYHRHHPDLVLMDHNMARLNGATACRNILARDPAAQIVFVSGACSGADLSYIGAVATLPKPVTLADLTTLFASRTLPAAATGPAAVG